MKPKEKCIEKIREEAKQTFARAVRILKNEEAYCSARVEESDIEFILEITYDLDLFSACPETYQMSLTLCNPSHGELVRKVKNVKSKKEIEVCFNSLLEKVLKDVEKYLEGAKSFQKLCRD